MAAVNLARKLRRFALLHEILRKQLKILAYKQPGFRPNRVDSLFKACSQNSFDFRIRA
jgi:hypothetical protein